MSRRPILPGQISVTRTLQWHVGWSESLCRALASAIMLAVCIVACACCLVASVSAVAASANVDELSGMRLVAETESLSLYINEATTEVAVLEKSTGVVWRSNPWRWETMERKASGTTKNRLGSQIHITYYTPNDQQKTMDNYNDSILHGQFVISDIEDGVRIEYTVGKMWGEEDNIPVMISKKRLEEMVLSKVENERDRDRLLEGYELVVFEELAPGEEMTEIPGLRSTGFDIDSVFGRRQLVSLSDQYQDLRSQIQALSDGGSASGASSSQLTRLRAELASLQASITTRVLNVIVSYRRDLNSLRDIRREHVESLAEPVYVIKANIPRWTKQTMLSIFNAVGYTPFDAQHDHEDNHIDPPQPNTEVFQIPVEYTLDGDTLVVRIPGQDIRYPKDVVDLDGRYGMAGGLVTFPLYSMRVLEFFGAADLNQEGYMFVPDGSGALINLNSGRIAAKAYNEAVYGLDNSVASIEQLTDVGKERIHLPVFGLRMSDEAMVAVIESGDALARIRADIAGRENSYNNVFAEFILTPRATLQLSTKPSAVYAYGSHNRNSINVYQSRPYEQDIQIRYAFLSGSASDYVGMATWYQSYLVGKYGLERLAIGDRAPFYAGLIGAVSRTRPILGIATETMDALTTYEQVRQVQAELTEGGIDNLKLRYIGWLHGGIKHVFPAGVSLERSLGSQGEFSKLLADLRSSAADLYLDVGFLNVARDELLDGFSTGRDAARQLDRQVATIYGYDPATLMADKQNRYYVVSPRSLGTAVDRFIKDLKSYGAERVSLRYMGSQLNSDFRVDPQELIDRQQALEIQKEQLRAIQSGLLHKILVDGANAYALPFASDIVNMPMSSSEQSIIDMSVPFYQIAIHGFISYAGEPINLAGDYTRSVLKTVETGACLYYEWGYTIPPELSNTEFSHLYAADYRSTKADALRLYADVASVLRGLYDQRIVGHKQLASGVYQTVYENGSAVVVNYNEDPVRIGDIEIPGQYYRLLEVAI